MSWFETHVYIAEWIAVVLAALTFALAVFAIVSSKGKSLALPQVDWFRFVLYVTFLFTLAVMFVPQFGLGATLAASSVAGMFSGFIVVFRPDAKYFSVHFPNHLS